MKKINNPQNLFATVSFCAARATLALFAASILPIVANAEDSLSRLSS
jgi:ABC-type proline/glycine betaine transport system permease subunit